MFLVIYCGATVKLLVTVFWDIRGSLLVDFLTASKTVNADN